MRSEVVEVVVHLSRPSSLHGQWHAAYPYILFVYRVGQPQVIAGRCGLALGDATDITGTEILVLAHESAWGNLAMHHAYRVERDAVIAGDGYQWIAVGLGLDGIIADGPPSVGRALPPLLSARHDERRHAHGRAPCLALVGRQRRVRPFPQGHHLAVASVEVRSGLHPIDRILEMVKAVEPTVLVNPLESLEFVVEQSFAGLLEPLVLGRGVKGVGGVGFIP